MVKNSTFQIRFPEPDRLSYFAEQDPPLLWCHWLPTAWLRFLNRVVNKLFYVNDKCFAELPCKVHTVDKRLAVDAIMQQEDWIHRIYCQQARGILIGPKQMNMVMAECQPFDFRVEFEVGGYRGVRVCGLSVEVVPWLDGIILLPARNA